MDIYPVYPVILQLSIYESEESVSCSIVSDSLWPHELWPASLFCPWSSLGRNTGGGCHFLLQRIFSTQGLDLGLPALETDSLPSEPPGKPEYCHIIWIYYILIVYLYLIDILSFPNLGYYEKDFYKHSYVHVFAWMHVSFLLVTYIAGIYGSSMYKNFKGLPNYSKVSVWF